MLRALFPRAGARYESSLFGLEITHFCEWLQDTGYSKDSIEGHLRRLFKVLTATGKLGIAGTRSSVVLHRMFERHCTCEYLSHLFRATERAYCRFLRTQGRVKKDADKRDTVYLLLQRYQRYLQDVRGFCEATAVQHGQTVSEFFGKVLRPRRGVRAITSEHVEQYLIYKSKLVSRQTMQHVVARLRAFFRYGAYSGPSWSRFPRQRER